MARPKAKELTERELEVMHVFWQHGELTAAEARDALASEGRRLAYTTVATLIRILCEKSFLEQVNAQRPFRFRAARSFEEVSGNLVRDLVQRVFGGAREQLLAQLFGGRKKLSTAERAILEEILKEQD
ncbi:MAG: transcriptional regulator [Pirellulaceae bacterium]|nr:MAG: transcriptional regulator [Pirellulaceae bacterium]